jgi:hypothetical protein
MELFVHPMKDGVLLDFGAAKTVGLDMYMEYGWQSNNRIRRALGATCIFYSFLIKGNILISWRYQLHSASTTTQYPNDRTDTHNQKKEKEIKKIKVPVQNSRPYSNNTTTTVPRQDLNYNGIMS